MEALGLRGKLAHKHVRDWSVDNVCAWIGSAGAVPLGQAHWHADYAARFRSARVDGVALLALSAGGGGGAAGAAPRSSCFGRRDDEARWAPLGVRSKEHRAKIARAAALLPHAATVRHHLAAVAAWRPSGPELRAWLLGEGALAAALPPECAARYADALAEAGVDGALLLELGDEDLALSPPQGVGVASRAHRRALLRAIQQLREGVGFVNFDGGGSGIGGGRRRRLERARHRSTFGGAGLGEASRQDLWRQAASTAGTGGHSSHRAGVHNPRSPRGGETARWLLAATSKRAAAATAAAGGSYLRAVASGGGATGSGSTRAAERRMGEAGRERAAREGARRDGAAATVQRACRARAARRAARGEWAAGAASVADARRAVAAADGYLSPSEDGEVGAPGLDEAGEGAGEEEQAEGEGGDDGEQRHRERRSEGRRAVKGAAPTLPPRLAFRSAHAKVLCARDDARRWGVAQALCWLKHVVGRARDGKREGPGGTTSSMAALYGAAFADAAVDGVVLLGCLCDDDLRQEPFCMRDAGHRRHIMGKVAELRESSKRAARAGRAARRSRAS